MKCVNQDCPNIIIDYTGNVDGRCAKCRLVELFLYFGEPQPDTNRLEQTQVSREEIIDSDRTARDYADERIQL